MLECVGSHRVHSPSIHRWQKLVKVPEQHNFNARHTGQVLQQGKMKPVIDEVLPLEKAAQGLKLIEDREVFGKVIITP